MATQIYVNLPVKDLKRSVDFFTALGFSFNPDYTDENATCMIINDNAFVMLLVEGFFKTFTSRDVADATSSTEAIVAFSVDSKEDVDATVRKALAAGGAPSQEVQDYGFMYNHSFQDLDGHLWEVLWTDAAGPPADDGAPAGSDGQPT
ncbi:VOC family protein [Pseudarthrobacter sp. AB1]|uniref:VOC family protein n=1 Tax=Pseudarthrobacter sp. AB1 TaxID=2138309 RepID=UPI00186B8ADD|nr:VOC family protein [Pseudarthrobacter sp. AB1]MBE4716770.1 glyoxalase [Pseudarthrobacter sp. AB1]